MITVVSEIDVRGYIFLVTDEVTHGSQRNAHFVPRRGLRTEQERESKKDREEAE